MTNISFRITSIVILIFIAACKSKAKSDRKDYTRSKIEQFLVQDFEKFWQNLPVKSTPFTDTTSFDNVNVIQTLSPQEIAFLQLEEIYPNIEQSNSQIRIQNFCKLALSNNYYTIVLTVFKGDHEIESVLLNYNMDKQFVDSKIISYDEIAEGWSRKEGIVSGDTISIIDKFYGNKIQIDSSFFVVDDSGKICELKSSYGSVLRPNQKLSLDSIYSDTIVFLAFDNNYDYFTLQGEKNGILFNLIYNTEDIDVEKIGISKGTTVVVEWKLDSIYIAGEAETLGYKEWLTDLHKLRKIDDRFIINFDEFDIDLGALDIWAENNKVFDLHKDTVIVSVGFAIDIEGQSFKIIQKQEGSFKLYQRFENSITVMNEGPHCDLINWKHYNSEWEELITDDGNFLMSSSTQKDRQKFIEVEMSEVIEVVREQCGSEWSKLIKNVQKPTEYPCGVGRSRVFLKIKFSALNQASNINKVISFEIPMGC